MSIRSYLGLLSMAAVLCAWLAAPLRLFSQAGAPDVLDDPVVRGAWLYEGNCTRCHGAYGDQRVGAGKARKELAEQIAGGRTGRCQVDWALTEGGTLSTADLRDLVRFILTWEELGAPPDLPELPPQPTPTPRPSPTPAQVDAGQPTPTPSPTPDPVLATVAPIIAHSPVAEGAWLVHANCAKCHGPYATGRMGQNLPLDQVRDAIIGGKGGTNMPAFALTQGGSLRSRQIDAILAYIAAWESLGESPALPDAMVNAIQATRFDQASLQPILPPVVPVASGDPQAGLALYLDHCRNCHGSHGEGRIGGPLAQTWSSVRQDLTIRATLAHGITGTLMPAWSDRNGGPLTDAQLDDLVALLVGWSLARADGRDLAGAEQSAAATSAPWRGVMGMAGLLLALSGIAVVAFARAGR